MKIAYIAGKYRAKTIRGIYENIRKAEKVAIRYWKLGYAVICPHKNTELLDGACDDSVWLKGDLEILKRCDLVVAMKGWEQSKGASAEIRTAKENKIKVIYDKGA